MYESSPRSFSAFTQSATTSPDCTLSHCICACATLNNAREHTSTIAIAITNDIPPPPPAPPAPPASAANCSDDISLHNSSPAPPIAFEVDISDTPNMSSSTSSSVPKRLRKRLLETVDKSSLSIQEIESKLKEADLRRQVNFYI